jgi:5-methylcytosine-specific restriction endonuclease McrA
MESLFKEGMTWDNYGEWEIDHIIPLSSSNSEKELNKLFHYTNLQPLWAVENLKKKNRMIKQLTFY